MIDFLNGPVLTTIIIIIVAVSAMFLGKSGFLRKVPSLDTILKYAQVAVTAIEKLSDNGQYANLPTPERHARKKEDAVKFVEESLRSEFGVKVTPVLSYLIDMAIEAALKQLDM